MKLFDVKISAPGNFIFIDGQTPLSVVAENVPDAIRSAVAVYNMKVNDISDEAKKSVPWQTPSFADASHVEAVTIIRRQVFTESV